MSPRPNFVYSHTAEPHFLRRRAMLRSHPGIRALFGTDPRVAITTAWVFTAQLSIAAAVSFADVPWWGIVVLALGVGAVLNHWLAMTIHETSHALVFRSRAANRCLAVIANIPLLVPLAMSFHRYHVGHHQLLGVDTQDTDLPHELEVRLIGNHRIRKLLWLLFNNLFYLARGIVYADWPPSRLEWMNLGVVVVADGLLLSWLGLPGTAYLLLSTMVGLSFHPVAAHFIHEHFTFAPNQQTFSYYGPLNHVTYNVGYHVEHHDFMNIPGSRLPELRALAPEYYDDLVSHTSWTAVLWRFVVDPGMGLESRIVRTVEDYERGRQPRMSA